MTRFLNDLIRDERGATALEYGLILALMSVVIVSAVSALGKQLYGLMNNTVNALAH